VGSGLGSIKKIGTPQLFLHNVDHWRCDHHSFICSISYNIEGLGSAVGGGSAGRIKTQTWMLMYITVWTVVHTVLTATFNSYGDRQISTPPHKINTLEPIDKKFGTIDYVRERTSYTKFGRNPSTGGFWANGWNITKIIFIYTFFLWSAYRSDPWMNFYAR